MISSGTEPTTLRFVAQHLTHCATAVPCVHLVGFITTIYDYARSPERQMHTSCLTGRYLIQYQWYKYNETYKTGTLVAYDIHYWLCKSDMHKNITMTSSPLPLVSIVLDYRFSISWYYGFGGNIYNRR